jgi:hypothetical protein
MTIEAWLTETNQIHFYEKHENDHNWIKRLTDERVKSLFFADTLIKRQPFLLKENKQFKIVLFRNRVKYRLQFEALKKQLTIKKSKIRRAK